jgi:hypothetical protein
MDPGAHGESSKTGEGHDMATRGRDIKAVIHQLKLSPVILVGWSNGVTEVDVAAGGAVDEHQPRQAGGAELIEMRRASCAACTRSRRPRSTSRRSSILLRARIPAE